MNLFVTDPSPTLSAQARLHPPPNIRRLSRLPQRPLGHRPPPTNLDPARPTNMGELERSSRKIILIFTLNYGKLREQSEKQTEDMMHAKDKTHLIRFQFTQVVMDTTPDSLELSTPQPN